MQRKIIVIISLLFIVALFWRVADEHDCKDSSVWVKENNPIYTVQPEINDFSDLQFLKTVLADKQIVLLGEQTHYDATTCLAKTRLVRFLHQEMGFDVILFEGGLYDVWLMSSLAKMKQKPLDPRMGLYWFWSDVSEMDFFWNYVCDHNLYVGGFDVQYQTGNIGDSLQFQLLENYFFRKGLHLDCYPSFLKMKNRMFWSQYYDENDRMYSKGEKDSIIGDLKRMIVDLIPYRINEEDSIYICYLQNMCSWLGCVWQYSWKDVRRFHIRDSLMAENVFWQLERFPNAKVVIWAANMHVAAARKEADDSFTTLGERVREKFGKHSYVICFSSYCRLNKFGNVCQKSGIRSLETKIHCGGYRYGFIDFRHLSADVVDDSLWTEVNQRMNIKTTWARQMDGLFFMDTMKSLVYQKH